jgi:hypothetical protein
MRCCSSTVMMESTAIAVMPAACCSDARNSVSSDRDA